MTTPRGAGTFAVEHWFLARGLPAVLRPGALLHRVWGRSAPALAATAVVALNSIAIVAATGRHTVDITGRPDIAEGVVLALLALVLPVAAFAGWLVSRLPTNAARTLAAHLALALIAVGMVFGGPGNRVPVNLTVGAVAVVAILAATASGIGSILGWAAQGTCSNLALIGGMIARALPVVLLTFLVFFNGPMWQMTAVIGRERLWAGMVFLFLIAAAFLVSGTLDRVRPILTATPALDGDQTLAGTPLENLPDGPAVTPLSGGERANVVFVVAASQVSQVLTVALTTGAIFFVLGLILVSPQTLDSWTRGAGRPDGNLLGMTLPIPDALIQTSMLLTAITFMYLSAKAVTDATYRAQFLDPLVADLRLTLVARNRYRAKESG